MRSLGLALLALLLVTACTEEVLFDFEENLAEEVEAINAFLSTHDIDVDVTESGLRYRLTVPGNGVFADSRDSIIYDFQIYLLDSTFIDSTIEEVLDREGQTRFNTGPAESFVQREIENLNIIYCFKEAFRLASEGTSIQMFVPSHLAYGNRGAFFGLSPGIPSNAILLVQIDMLRVIKRD